MNQWRIWMKIHPWIKRIRYLWIELNESSKRKEIITTATRDLDKEGNKKLETGKKRSGWRDYHKRNHKNCLNIFKYNQQWYYWESRKFGWIRDFLIASLKMLVTIDNWKMILNI